MKKTMKSFVLVTLLGFLGKGIGLYRSILLAKQFGSSKETDAFIIALTGVLILSSLLTSSMNNIVVMTISKEDDKNKRIEIVNNILNITLLVSFLLIVSMYFLSPVFISILSSGFEGEQFELKPKIIEIESFKLIHQINQNLLHHLLSFLKFLHKIYIQDEIFYSENFQNQIRRLRNAKFGIFIFEGNILLKK